jgi:amino acid permease
MLVECGLRFRQVDFERLTERGFGRLEYMICLTVMLVFAFGGQIAYLNVIGDTLPLIAEAVLTEGIRHSILFSRTAFILFASIYIILPIGFIFSI